MVAGGSFCCLKISCLSIARCMSSCWYYLLIVLVLEEYLYIKVASWVQNLRLEFEKSFKRFLHPRLAVSAALAVNLSVVRQRGVP